MPKKDEHYEKAIKDIKAYHKKNAKEILRSAKKEDFSEDSSLNIYLHALSQTKRD